jgi:tetratricopeptide (TPR) repeat protein
MKVLTNQILIFSLLIMPSAVLGQSQSAPPPSTPAQSKTRIRRSAAQTQPKATPQPAVEPTETPEPTPEATPSPVPSPEEAAAPAPTEVTEAAAAETPKAKPEPVVTPEARLREQLKVVEQMVAQGLKQEALAELHSLAAEDRFDPQGFYNIANAFARLDATDAAVNAYRKALEQRNGHYSRAANNLGVILLRQGFWDQAYDAFLSALRTENFHYAEASYNLGRLYAARGEMDRAFREWRRAVKVDPNHAPAIQALNKGHNLNRSIPKSSVPPSKQGGRVSAPDPSAASKSSLPVFTLDSETNELLQRARSAHEKGRYEDAVEGFRRVIARQGGYFAPANLELSYSLMELRRNDEATAMLLLVAQKDSARFPITYYHLGRLYEQRGDLRQAEENYLRATQAHQVDNAQFLLNLSSVREKRGDFAGALVAMENYIQRKEKQGQKPDWSDSRLASLREKAAAQNPKQ